MSNDRLWRGVGLFVYCKEVYEEWSPSVIYVPESVSLSLTKSSLTLLYQIIYNLYQIIYNLYVFHDLSRDLTHITDRDVFRSFLIFSGSRFVSLPRLSVFHLCVFYLSVFHVYQPKIPLRDVLWYHNLQFFKGKTPWISKYI